MSSYIIAGSADSIDTAYCEEIARRIKAKYKNIDFRIVIKHPSEWEQYLQQICRIYGFLKKSNPIIYTFDGKIIGNKQAFMSATAKYFGLDQQALNVQNLSNQVNMKMATEQINRKHVQKNNIKTLTQKIQSQYQKLLKQNVLKHELKQKKQFLTNGIQYIHRSVVGLVPNISFIKNKEVKVQIQTVTASDIDIMAISLNDQIKIQEQPAVLPTNAVASGKEAFVTTNQKNNSEHDKMSEVSRTNKMHESIISYDKDSKQMKQSSKSKLRIDEQNDDLFDYVDYPMNELIVSQLTDNFYVGFSKNSHITGEMILYHNQDQNGGNSLRIYNDNRPVNGHRPLIQVHYDGGNRNLLLEDSPSQIVKTQQAIEAQLNEDEQPGIQANLQKEEKSQQFKKQQSKILSKPKTQIQKIRTQPNIPHAQQPTNNIGQDDDAFSQINSDLNLISHLNYHTLFVQRPLSSIQIKNLIYFIQETNCIGCLQFLGENPNPKVKLYHRKLLLETQKSDKLSLLLPVQKFIQKQLQDNQFSKTSVPNQKCFDYESISDENKFQILQINDLGFQHYLYKISNTEGNNSSEEIVKVLKYTIDLMCYLEQQQKKQIGYNIVFTKEFIMIVPLSEPYEIYNSSKLYFDGLAYLGFVHTANALKPYELNKKSVNNMGNHLRKLLHDCSNVKKQD